MTTPPNARGRKHRLVRAAEEPHDVLLVIRAAPADREAAVDAMVEDAELSARQYVVEVVPGSREVLYGVSVFARRPGDEVAAVLDRFTGAPAYLEVAVGDLRGAGFGVYPTGANSDHFDVQLIGGLREGDPGASASDLRDAAVHVLAVGGSLKANPAYAGDTTESS